MTSQHFSPDVQEFLQLLARFQVQYLIVGGEAVIYHGYARLTGDIDFFYHATPDNVQNLYEALKLFWGGQVPAVQNHAELLQPGLVLQYGRPPNRIDLINAIAGVSFSDAWQSKIREEIQVAGKAVPVYYIGLDALIKNKEAAGRDKDRDDLRFLRRKK